MKKVKELLKALDDLKTAQEEARKEVNDQLLSASKSHNDAMKEGCLAALRIIKDLEEQRSEAIKVLSRI